MLTNLAPQESDFEMSESDVAQTQRDAQRIFDNLAESQPRAVMLWLASFFRQWDFMAKSEE